MHWVLAGKMEGEEMKLRVTVFLSWEVLFMGKVKVFLKKQAKSAQKWKN